MRTLLIIVSKALQALSGSGISFRVRVGYEKGWVFKPPPGFGFCSGSKHHY